MTKNEQAIANCSVATIDPVCEFGSHIKFIFLLAFIGLLAGCNDTGEHHYAVAISGTDGTPFSGTCQILSAGGSSSQDAAGIVPHSFDLDGTLISCVVQKRDEEGTLRIRISREDGSPVAEGWTSEPYGVASAAGQ